MKGHDTMKISANFSARYTISISRGTDDWDDIERRHTAVKGRKIRPGQIVTDYTWHGFDDRGVWDHGTTTISGPVIRKDGSDGAIAGERYYGKSDLPEWAQNLVRTAAMRLPDLRNVR
jgi:hypothetical protein